MTTKWGFCNLNVVENFIQENFKFQSIDFMGVGAITK